ncbi:MAG: RNA 2',3'-cyclic phosphodiesterase [Planctomycetaceae bacterium]|nr:RNA 2',3'-cyclic phosphodiesterase [Planctomycetaceae bacterium]
MPIRTFIAFSLPCPTELARVLKQLGLMAPAVKATSPRGLHCTLRFLGDTSVETAAALGPEMALAVRDLPPFTARLQGLGAFPNPARPNVVWAGIESPALQTLFERIDEVASRAGFAADHRPFRPHVTLARIKQRPPPPLGHLLQQHVATGWGEFEVDAVSLYKSTLSPAGSQYAVLASAPLGR